MAQPLQRVTIVGTGLIGGSLALALKRAFPGVRVAGVDKPDVAERALRLNIIDAAGAEPAEPEMLAETALAFPRVRASLGTLVPGFCAGRMLAGYEERMYLPAPASASMSSRT